MPSTPCSSASAASRGCWMPLSRIGSSVRDAQVVEVGPGQRGAGEHVEERLDGGPRQRRAEVVAQAAGVVAGHRDQRAHGGRGRARRGLRRGRRSASRRRAPRPAAGRRGSLVYCAMPSAAGERQVGEVEVAGAPAEHVGVEGDDDRLAADRLGAGDERVDDARRPCSSRAGTSAGESPERRRRSPPSAPSPAWRSPSAAPGSRAARGHGVLGVAVRHLEHPDRGEAAAARAAGGRTARPRCRGCSTSTSIRGTIRCRSNAARLARAVRCWPAPPATYDQRLRAHPPLARRASSAAGSTGTTGRRPKTPRR